jgi:hypothetical protein
MEAKDLMVDDWVCTENDSTPRQIDWIRSGEVGLFWGQTVTPPYLEPIPLTAEILEKNGFPLDVEETNHPLYKGTEIKEYTISMPPNGYREHLIWIGEYYIMFDAPKVRIDYVHQFQHALRLCGIDKEIVL